MAALALVAAHGRAMQARIFASAPTRRPLPRAALDMMAKDARMKRMRSQAAAAFVAPLRFIDLHPDLQEKLIAANGLHPKLALGSVWLRKALEQSPRSKRAAAAALAAERKGRLAAHDDQQRHLEISQHNGASDSGPEIFEPFVTPDRHGAFVSPSWLPGRGVSNKQICCRACDHTLFTGDKGVHLFEWHDSWHLCINDELMDGQVIRAIRPAENSEALTTSSSRGPSQWRLSKIACPNCDSLIGSVGLVGLRIKMLLKSMSIAWRSAPPPSAISGLQAKDSTAVQRLGLSIQSTSLAANLGLATHDRKMVIDGAALSQALLSTTPPSTLLLSPDIETDAVRSAASSLPWAPTPAMLSRILAADAIRAVVASPPKEAPTTLFKWLQAIEVDERKRLAEDSSLDVAEFRKRRERLLFIAACHFSPRVPAVGVPLANKLFDDLLKLGQDRAHFDQVPARVLAGASLFLASTLANPAVFTEANRRDEVGYLVTEALQNVVNELVARKKTFGPPAAAFGVAADLLTEAVVLHTAHMQTLGQIFSLNQAVVPHPTPCASFALPEVVTGMVRLECTEKGCEARPTHGFSEAETWSLGKPMPQWCHLHAAVGATRLVELYVNPNQQRHIQRRGSFFRGGKRQAIVPVPDANATSMAPTPRGFFPLTVPETNVIVAYNDEEAAMVAAELESLCARADELVANGVPSMETAIGVDVEWRPWFSMQVQPNPASIVQIATREKAYVIDVISQGGKLADTLKRLFLSRAVVKLGHGLGEDLFRLNKALANATGDADFSFFPVPSVFELAPLYAQFKNETYNVQRPPSLANMVRHATDLELNKQCQMTDWERRPLSPAQVQYAAIDALCAHTLFEAFSKTLVGPGLRHETIESFLGMEQARVLPATPAPPRPPPVLQPHHHRTYSPTLLPSSSAYTGPPRPARNWPYRRMTPDGEPIQLSAKESLGLFKFTEQTRKRLRSKGWVLDEVPSPLESLELAEQLLTHQVRKVVGPSFLRPGDPWWVPPPATTSSVTGSARPMHVMATRSSARGALETAAAPALSPPAAVFDDARTHVGNAASPNKTVEVSDQLRSMGFDDDDARELSTKLVAQGFKTRLLVLTMNKDDLKACGFSLGQIRQFEIATGKVKAPSAAASSSSAPPFLSVPAKAGVAVVPMLSRKSAKKTLGALPLQNLPKAAPAPEPAFAEVRSTGGSRSARVRPHVNSGHTGYQRRQHVADSILAEDIAAANANEAWKEAAVGVLPSVAPPVTHTPLGHAVSARSAPYQRSHFLSATSWSLSSFAHVVPSPWESPLLRRGVTPRPTPVIKPRSASPDVGSQGRAAAAPMLLSAAHEWIEKTLGERDGDEPRPVEYVEEEQEEEGDPEGIGAEALYDNTDGEVERGGSAHDAQVNHVEEEDIETAGELDQDMGEEELITLVEDDVDEEEIPRDEILSDETEDFDVIDELDVHDGTVADHDTASHEEEDARTVEEVEDDDAENEEEERRDEDETSGEGEPHDDADDGEDDASKKYNDDASKRKDI